MADRQWYFNISTERAELGPQSPVSQRMGPYKSRQDALNAWEIVRRRNKDWDQADSEWTRWPGESPDGERP